MLQQLTTMLEMQDRMNRKVHPDWINQQFAWYRALWIECGELIEHYGYKWWKHQQPAWGHVPAPPQTMELREAVEALAGRALVGREFPVGHFWSLLQAAGMTPDELFTAYVGKNVLNFFRQDHGYKDGSYRKTWQGREDNEHLAELLGQLDSRSPRYADELYGALAARYAQVAAAHA